MVDALSPGAGGDPLMPQELHDALGAVRSRGAYYGGVPVVPGVPGGIAAAPRQLALPTVRGPDVKELPAEPANQNLPFRDFERLRIIDKLLAAGDHIPVLRDGRMVFRSLTPEENRIMNLIGWGRAPDVTHEAEIADPAAAWEKNLRYWRSLMREK